jgi:hypothetical protein
MTKIWTALWQLRSEMWRPDRRPLHDVAGCVLCMRGETNLCGRYRRAFGGEITK